MEINAISTMATIFSTHVAIKLPFKKLTNCNLGTFKQKLSHTKKRKGINIPLLCLWQEQQAFIVPCNMSVSASVTSKMGCQGGVLCSRADYRVKATIVISIFAPVRKRH